MLELQLEKYKILTRMLAAFIIILATFIIGLVMIILPLSAFKYLLAYGVVGMCVLTMVTAVPVLIIEGIHYADCNKLLRTME
jgi:hypothetical protein